MPAVRDAPQTSPYVLPAARLTVRTAALYDLLNWAIAVALLSLSGAGVSLWVGLQQSSLSPLPDSIVMAAVILSVGCAPLVDILRELRARHRARPL